MLCFFFLRQREESGTSGASLFLIGTLAVLLLLRGFYWLSSVPAAGTLGRLVFAAATLLPLAITLFVERLLRRHHPLPLKFLSMTISTLFFGLNVVSNLPEQRAWLLAFLAGLTLVIAWNGWLLLFTRSAELSSNERKLARALVLAVTLSIPLIATDFRTMHHLFPVRLGAIGALLFVYVLLSLVETRDVLWALGLRVLAVLSVAAALSSTFALAIHGFEPDFVRTALSTLPIAAAWALLAAISARIFSLSTLNDGNHFLRWLLHARLDTAQGFLHSLKRLPQTAHHEILTEAHLAGYSLLDLVDVMMRHREPVSLAEVRAWAVSPDRFVDGAEQLVDLLERHQMTHALLVSRGPVLILLLSLPQGAHAAIGRVRAGVIQRIARRLAE